MLAALGSLAHAEEREAPPVREVQEIPLPGVQGRLDHFTIDAKRKRVIFSGLGNNTVQVVDVFAVRMIHQIESTTFGVDHSSQGGWLRSRGKL